MKHFAMSSLVTFSLLLSSCATTTPYNQTLATKNMALIADSVFVPGISPSNATLKAVDGQETKFMSSSNEVLAGKRKLVISCTYYLSSMHQFKGVNTLEVSLEPGHTYKLIPVLPVPRTGECKSIIKDETGSK